MPFEHRILGRTVASPHEIGPGLESASAPVDATEPYTPAEAKDFALRLRRLNHFVVLMLENRSFDHMLGHRSREAGGAAVDGARPGVARPQFLPGGQVRSFEPRPLAHHAFPVDPPHDRESIRRQLESAADLPTPQGPVTGSNMGFLRTFAASLPTGGAGALPHRAILDFQPPGHVPVLNWLARNHTVCDRWFAPVAGPTWLNRQYALAGSTFGRVDDQLIPLYRSRRAVVDALDEGGVRWHWLFHDLSTLPSLGRLPRPSRTSLFSPARLTELLTDVEPASVVWIDPNFNVDGKADATANDDHPAGSVLPAQRLIQQVYDALVDTGPETFSKTLLVVVYDEHGGFYDHVAPPAIAREDESPEQWDLERSPFRRMGVRVPAVLASPHVEGGHVHHGLFDHTSILKTLLVRFCRDAQGRIPDLGRRVTRARHLGEALRLSLVPRPILDRVPEPVTSDLSARLSALRARGPRMPGTLQAGLVLARAKTEAARALETWALEERGVGPEVALEGLDDAPPAAGEVEPVVPLDWDALYDLSAAALGQFIAADAAATGFPVEALDASLERGLLTSPFPGVYRMASAADSDVARALAAWLWSGRRGAFSHGTAAWWNRRRRTCPAEVHMTVSAADAAALPPTPEGIVLHVADLSPDETRAAGPARATTPRRTEADLRRS